MNSENAKELLQLLGQELQKQQVTGEILFANGVVALLDIREPEESDDIEAYFGGHGTTIRQAVAGITGREGLPDNWLNNALKDLFRTPSSHEKWLEYPGLRVYPAPTAYVLAMKVATACYPQDIEDSKILAEKLGISNTQDMLTIITKYVPEQMLTPEMRSIVEHALCYTQTIVEHALCYTQKAARSE